MSVLFLHVATAICYLPIAFPSPHTFCMILLDICSADRRVVVAVFGLANGGIGTFPTSATGLSCLTVVIQLVCIRTPSYYVRTVPFSISSLIPCWTKFCLDEKVFWTKKPIRTIVGQKLLSANPPARASKNLNFIDTDGQANQRPRKAGKLR